MIDSFNSYARANAYVSRTIWIISGAEHDPRSAAVVHERSRAHNKRGRAEEHIPAEHAEQRWEQLTDRVKLIQEANGQAAADKAAGDGFDRWTRRSWAERWGWQLPARQR